ncbi:hypothetical protein MMC28_005319 [Mycoblastus sanguinarius]|nr:hypothetical protein [Mycoblastus sanguinarius]
MSNKRGLPHEAEKVLDQTNKRFKASSATQDGADNTLNQSTQRLALSKRPSEDNVEEISDQPNKRSKIDSHAEPDERPSHTVEVSSQNITANNAPDLISTSSIDPPIPPEVNKLQHKYEFTTMSILSSSKIEQKVRNLLLRVGSFNFADTKARPGIVILHAKANVASKMVSIVEIAKKIIQEENGKWWQYSKLEGQILELKARQAKRTGSGKTLSEWESEHSKVEATAAVAGEVLQDAAIQGHQGKEGADVDDGSEEAFETMSNPKHARSGAISEGENRKKVRAVPVMTIYFARVPVPGLKELYGEQSNA